METKEFALTGTETRSVDPAALVALYETHGERMKSVAMNLLGRRSDAEDAVQEAFLRIFRGAGEPSDFDAAAPADSAFAVGPTGGRRILLRPGLRAVG